MEKDAYLGVDVGSVSTNLVLMDEAGTVLRHLYLKTGGYPMEAIRRGLELLSEGAPPAVAAVGATGSGRQLAGLLLDADVVKNEITAHAAAAVAVRPDVRTILEIGGQDSKIIFVKDGMVTDFAMNTVCAAGTGSFLDRQAARLDIPIESFGAYALKARHPVRIAGRCAVFAESDMIHKQQTGHCSEDIIAGLCQALARNYLSNLAKGKVIEAPVLFQGGVAANVGIVAAFEQLLDKQLIIPPHYHVMGAYGAALLAREEVRAAASPPQPRPLGSFREDFEVKSSECGGCSNLCELVLVRTDGQLKACWGDRCGKWSASLTAGAPAGG